jgi:hypothetical protein
VDLNLVVLAGRLAAPIEIRESDTGPLTARLLLAVRSGGAEGRIDVVPVTMGGPPPELEGRLVPGTRVWAAGTVRRRFCDGARSRLDIVAHAVEPRPEDGGSRQG